MSGKTRFKRVHNEPGQHQVSEHDLDLAQTLVLVKLGPRQRDEAKGRGPKLKHGEHWSRYGQAPALGQTSVKPPYLELDGQAPDRVQGLSWTRPERSSDRVHEQGARTALDFGQNSGSGVCYDWESSLKDPTRVDDKVLDPYSSPG